MFTASSNNRYKPSTSSERNHDIDFIRTVALVGICVVNVPFMGLPIEAAFTPPQGLIDKSTGFFIEVFFQLKFFLLFSFVFGWGIAIQARSAQKRAQPFATRYFRRMIGLCLLGALHAIFVFSGDILVLYAVLGILLWQVKDRSPLALMKIAAWMIPLSLLSLSVLAITIDTLIAQGQVALPVSGPGLSGGYLQATRARLVDWPVTFVFLLFLQGPLAFGAFAAGLAAAKANFFNRDSKGFELLQRNWLTLLIIAVPLNVLFAAVTSGIIPVRYELLSLAGFALIGVGAPMMSAAYLYLCMCLAKSISLPGWLIRAGRNSLSSYVLQGVLAGLLFGGYGLSLFNTMNNAELVPVSVLIALTAMFLTSFYAKMCGRGPFEPILRIISGAGKR